LPHGPESLSHGGQNPNDWEDILHFPGATGPAFSGNELAWT
jgi:hypothetical protein